MNSWHSTWSGSCERLERRPPIDECEGGTNVTRAVILAAALTFVSVSAAVLTGLSVVSSMEGVRMVGLLILTTAIVASLLVLYFEWRGRLVRRVRAEQDNHDELENAAVRR
jgi:uncharacterized membrane protein